MSKFRRTNNQVDANQAGIVKSLRLIPGMKVITGMDDILVGYNGVNYWYEIKVSEKSSRQKGQIELEKNWPGRYLIVWNIDMILEDMGIA